MARLSAGGVDVAVIEIERPALPPSTVFRPFTGQHVLATHDRVEIGTPVLILGFLLGFQDEALGLNCAWYADILMTLTVC